MNNLVKWLRYIKRPWFSNHSLGIKFIVTSEKGRSEYCYKGHNFANTIVTRYRIFNVPICKKHFYEEIF